MKKKNIIRVVGITAVLMLIFIDPILTYFKTLRPSGKRARWVETYVQSYSHVEIQRTASPEFCPQIIISARELLSRGIIYDPAYQPITYPGGDVDPAKGVCADVIIRSYRSAGFDFQKLVHDHRKTNGELYPSIWPSKNIDPSIDHRRVPNLMTYLHWNQMRLPLSSSVQDYLPCDIVSWDLGGGVTHIGIVSDKKSPDGHPLIIHHIAGMPSENDVLFRWKIIGHYSLKEIQGALMTMEMKIGEEKKVSGGAKLSLVSVGHESASSGPGEPEQVYAVYHFTIFAEGKTGNISAPVETESAPAHSWGSYRLKVIKESPDHKSVTVKIWKE